MAVSITSLLDGVRKTGRDSYIAKCPAHADRSPSLTVRELADGRTLLHCFAGCETEAVLGAIGLSFRDVMPEKLGDSLPRERPAFPINDALLALASEAQLVAIASQGIAEGKPITPSDHERLCLAAGRILSAVDFLYGRH
jgi:CHC2 zinc finger